MANPWLAIALEDYEGHMGANNVRQLQALSELFRRVLQLCRPESIAVVGVAGGNGLERIDSGITKRIVGLDINAKYLEAVQQRHGALPGLELHCSDLNGERLRLPPVELVHAALFFEHAGLGRCLENVLSLVAPEGRLSVVLQLPSGAEPNVSPTRFTSIQALSESFALVDVRQFCEILEGKGLRLLVQVRKTLSSGKQFWLGIFGRRSTTP